MNLKSIVSSKIQLVFQRAKSIKSSRQKNKQAAGHFECKPHLFSQNQRLKYIPSQKFLTS